MARHRTTGQSIFIVTVGGSPLLSNGILLDSPSAELALREMCTEEDIKVGRARIETYTAWTYRPQIWGEGGEEGICNT